MSEWPTCAVADTFATTRAGRLNQIPAKDIASTGKYPVIDQGQDFISGYCDEVDKVIDFDLPLIIFGDHTRCLKYVDFPFVLGADGTKVIAPDRERFDPKFYYYALLSLDIPSRGYNRHFKALKEREIPIPSLPEQKAIAQTLATVQRAIEAQEQIIQTTKELKKALMQKLFSEGLRGEPQKETEIGLVPESWEVCTIGDVATIQSGGTPSRENPENWNGGTIPWVKTGEIDYSMITDTEEKITPLGLANSSARIFPKGTLLMAMYGQGITRGRVALLGIEAATNQACAAIIPLDPDKTLTHFLYYFFEFSYERLRQLGHGANQKNMSATLIRSFSLSLPSPREQQRIAESLHAIDLKLSLHSTKQAQLLALLRSLLHHLMKGDITINAEHTAEERL
jgi:type I restriction enzyme S subunit